MRKTILLSVLFALPILADAFNGKAKVGGIWYNIVTKAEKAEVTADYPIQHYQGRLVIPKTIVYEGVTCNVTAIAEGAFAQSEVQQVVIPNSVTSIGNRAFIYCDKLNSVTIPESVKFIGSYAFSGCYNLKNIKLPQNLESIEEGLFKGCNQLQAIEIPENVITIGRYAFADCRFGLKTVKIGNKVGTIGDDAFLECKELREIVLPNSIVEIGSQAFKDCKRLTTITLGNGVEKIQHGAFNGCGDLKDFYLNCDRLPEITNNAVIFYGSEIEYASLHVVESLIDLCKQVEPWKGFGKIIVNPNANTSNSAITAPSVDEMIYELKDCKGQIPLPYMKRYELDKWLEDHVQYPEEAKAKGISGSVTVGFVVEPDGSISNVKAYDGSWPELVSEAERVVRSMPKWKAGKVNGKNARVKDSIGVRFSR